MVAVLVGDVGDLDCMFAAVEAIDKFYVDVATHRTRDASGSGVFQSELQRRIVGVAAEFAIEIVGAVHLNLIAPIDEIAECLGIFKRSPGAIHSIRAAVLCRFGTELVARNHY